MLKKWWKILFKKDIFEIIDPEKKTKYESRLDKIIYRLKSEEIILSIKSWVYIIPLPEDKKLNKVDLLDKYYLELLKKYIKYHVWNSYYISWKKSLEIHNKDFSIAEKVFVVNRSLNKKIKFYNYEIIFKTISTRRESNIYLYNKKNWNKYSNLYSKFSNFVVKKNIEGYEFKISCLELSLLETALVSDLESGFDINLINKTLKKYSKVFDKSIFYEAGKYKYIMSFNRLKELSKNINRDLYEVFLDIIKKNWWLFIWEGLRGI